MEAVAITVVFTFINIVVILIKLEKGLWESLFIDICVIGAMNYMFLGMKDGMMVGMSVSFLITTYLYFRPPAFTKGLLA